MMTTHDVPARHSNYVSRVRSLASLFAMILLITLPACKDKANEDSNKMADTTTATQPQNTAPATTTQPVLEGALVNVSLSESKIDMPASLGAGPTNFVVKNDGNGPHNFTIKGNGIDQKLDDDVLVGMIRTLHVDLKPGTYTVSSPAKEGKETSMQLTVK